MFLCGQVGWTRFMFFVWAGGLGQVCVIVWAGGLNKVHVFMWVEQVLSGQLCQTWSMLLLGHVG